MHEAESREGVMYTCRRTLAAAVAKCQTSLRSRSAVSIIVTFTGTVTSTHGGVSSTSIRCLSRSGFGNKREALKSLCSPIRSSRNELLISPRL
jgi:hypothetical protein